MRTFAYKVYDMLELYLNPETFQSLASFKTKKFAVGLKPMLLFAGTAFESPVANEYTLAKSIFTDFFKGEATDKIDVEGLQYIVSFTAEDVPSSGDAKPVIHMRIYLIRTKRSGQKLPRVEVEEMGPRMDFRVGRMREPDEATRKEAMRKPKGLEERTKKNITTDSMGDKLGRVHLGRQDLSGLQTRKMKGLKRSRDVETEGFDDEEEIVEETTKKARK